MCVHVTNLMRLDQRAQVSYTTLQARKALRDLFLAKAILYETYFAEKYNKLDFRASDKSDHLN